MDLTRFKQRFENYVNSLELLQKTLNSDLEYEIICPAVIQYFEMTFEFAHKSINDLLKAGGIIVKPVLPKLVLKEAIESKIIKNEQIWLSMLEDRNISTHEYSQIKAKGIYERIKQEYLPIFIDLKTTFEEIVKKYE